MAFRYKLESLLRLRRGLERQEEQRLLAIAAEVAHLRAQLQHLEQSRLADRRSLHRDLMQGSTGAALQFSVKCDESYFTAIESIRKDLARAEERRLAQLRRYQEARRKREMLESLRERQQESYDLEFARHEQQSADEAFLLRSFTGLHQ